MALSRMRGSPGGTGGPRTAAAAMASFFRPAGNEEGGESARRHHQRAPETTQKSGARLEDSRKPGVRRPREEADGSQRGSRVNAGPKAAATAGKGNSKEQKNRDDSQKRDSVSSAPEDPSEHRKNGKVNVQIPAGVSEEQNLANIAESAEGKPKEDARGKFNHFTNEMGQGHIAPNNTVITEVPPVVNMTPVDQRGGPGGSDDLNLNPGSPLGAQETPPFKKQCNNVTPPNLGNPVNEEPHENLTQDQDWYWSKRNQEGRIGNSGDDHLRAHISALPTRQEMEGFFAKRMEICVDRLETLLKKEIKGVQETLQKVVTKISDLEAELCEFKEKISKIESTSTRIQNGMMGLHLQVMDLENRNRRQNIRIRGIPESVSRSDLVACVSSIFNHYLGRDENEFIELDRVHRAIGKKSRNVNSTRDVICKMHYDSQKEDIMQAAWDKGPTLVHGSQVILLQDLSKKTLDMRRAVKPILQVTKECGATYRWGYPFSVVIRRNDKTFVLKFPAQLPDLFRFLNTQPVKVQDWLEILEETPQDIRP